MGTYTPGPWHIGQGNGEGSIFAENGRMRLEKEGTTLYPICHIINFEGENNANAKLIAAAPELLEACKKALPWIGKMIADNGHLKSVMPNDCIRTMQMLDAAINKAEEG